MMNTKVRVDFIFWGLKKHHPEYYKDHRERLKEAHVIAGQELSMLACPVCDGQAPCNLCTDGMISMEEI